MGRRANAPERGHRALPHGAARRAHRAPVPASGARAASDSVPAQQGVHWQTFCSGAQSTDCPCLEK